MKICIFTETYYPVMGGGETQARLLAEGLLAAGHSVILLTRRSDRALKPQESYGPLTVYRLPPVGRGQLKKWGLIASSIPALVRLRGQYDLIFVSGFRIVGITAVLVSKLLGKRCVVKSDSQGEMSGDFFNNGLKNLHLSRTGGLFRAFLALRNRILRRADAFAAISPDIAEEYASHGVPPARIHPIPNGVDTARFFPVNALERAQLRATLGIPAGTKVAIYTGRLVTYKGLPLLLQVWRELCQKYPSLLIILAGTGGLDIHNCEDDLKAFVRTHHLETTVCFPGNVPNVPAYLQAADLFVFPTEDDALPSSLIEAMACGLPVLTTPVGAIKTIVSDGQNGLLIPPGHFQALSTALETLLTDADFATRLGTAGCATVRNHYSAKRVTQKYLQLFERVAG